MSVRERERETERERARERRFAQKTFVEMIFWTETKSLEIDCFFAVFLSHLSCLVVSNAYNSNTKLELLINDTEAETSQMNLLISVNHHI